MIKKVLNAQKVSVYIFRSNLKYCPNIFNVIATSRIYEIVKLIHDSWRVFELIPNLVSMSPKRDQVFTCYTHIKHIRSRICPQSHVIMKLQ